MVICPCLCPVLEFYHSYKIDKLNQIKEKKLIWVHSFLDFSPLSLSIAVWGYVLRDNHCGRCCVLQISLFHHGDQVKDGERREVEREELAWDKIPLKDKQKVEFFF